jgi:hypothetical protein
MKINLEMELDVQHVIPKCNIIKHSKNANASILCMYKLNLGVSHNLILLT